MRLLVLSLLIAIPLMSGAQSPWTAASNPASIKALEDQPLPLAFSAFDLDLASLATELENAPERRRTSGKDLLISLPDPQGGFHDFVVTISQVMHPDLAAKFPEIRSYVGYDPDFPARWVHMDLGPKGFHAMITCPGQDVVLVDPLDRQTGKGPYLAYAKSDYQPAGKTSFSCLTETDSGVSETTGGRGSVVDETLRTYRLALACTGEYATFHGGTKAQALAAMVVTINRINGLYEREFGVWLELIANNDKIIYLDAATDPFNNSNLSQILGENQTNTDNVIGSANYDMGHVFGTAGGGLATLNSPCNNSNKARAGTGLGNPVGDVFDVDYVAHEMGHQFGCDHTFNNDCSGNRNNSTAWEPGSGSTIMGYTGICAPNIQDDSDPYFHGGSLNQARMFTTEEGGNNCPVKWVSGNQLPSVEAGQSYLIPRSTPFELTAVGSDPDGDILTYTWEQFDNEIADMPPKIDNVAGPMFKSVLPDTLPTRTFPALNSILNNFNTSWEVLPAVSRTLNFRVTARDNHPGHGLYAQDATVVNVDENAGPFVVTNPNSLFPPWYVGDTVNITWNVANTDLAPISCSEVDILLSLDGGYTWPIVLGKNETNDGLHTIVVPFALSKKCRVKIKSVGNIFFDVSNVNFAIIEPSKPTFLIQGTPDQFSMCRGSQDTLEISLIGQPLSGFSDTVSLNLNSAFEYDTDLPASFILANLDTLIFHVWNINSGQTGAFPLELTAAKNQVSRTISFLFDFVDPLLEPVLLNAPGDNLDSIPLTPTLSWQPMDQTEWYRVEISHSPAFGATTLIDSLTPDSGLQVFLDDGQIYYWRVTAQNACGVGMASAIHVFRTRFSGCLQYTPAGLPITIPTTTLNFNSTVNVPDPGVVTDVNVFVDLTHTNLDDVTLRLLHPDGTGLTLVSKVCGNGQNILATFDDDGVPFFCGATPAVTGTVTPENGNLSVFNGKPTNGTWTLRIVDNKTQNGGTMNLWKLEVCQQVDLPPALLLATLNEVFVPYCDSAQLTPLHLTVNAAEADTTEIVLTLRVAPSHGTLTMNDQVLTVGDQFSQEAIDNGMIRYVHDGSGFLEDSFLVDVLRPSDQGWLPGIIVPIRVETNLQASLTEVEPVLCPDGQTGAVLVHFTGGKLPAEYRIFPDGDWQTDSLITMLGKGEIQIAVKDANGLETISPTLLISGPEAWMIASTVWKDTIRLTVEGATAPYTYALDTTTNTTGEFLVSVEGTYPVIVTDSLGCTTVEEVVVAFLSLDALVTSEIQCYGDSSATITLQAGGGTAPYEYRLNGSTYQMDPAFSGLPAGEYTGEVRDAIGTVTDLGVITILQPESLTLDADQTQDSVVVLSAGGGTVPYQYQLGSEAPQSSPQFNGLATGEYTFQVIDANGCVQEIYVTVMNSALEDPSGLLNKVVVRPNPSNGQFELVLPLSLVGSWSWTMQDITGRTARTGIAIAGVQTVSCADCSAGIYILHLLSADGQEVNLRVVIQ
ncbi:MAG: proprotein convertase P-domain-containing protein [Saprospiraceae bacterium]|nr:proprotein convertase P-domain-containing protein [Saprospiraceae bacterium]